MGFKCGIVGLPNVGKSTLFNALSNNQAEAANYPFCTIEPNVGIIKVPDSRLDALIELVRPQNVVPTVVQIVDIAGLVKGASKGEGLGNQFLANIRECDAIIHVLRCFQDENIVHVEASVNPLRDKEIIDTELQLKDLEALEKRLDKAKKNTKGGDKAAIQELELVQQLINFVQQGNSVRTYPQDDNMANLIQDMRLLTAKPVLYLCNVDEAGIATENEYVKQVREAVATENARVIVVCAAIEAQISQLDPAEQTDFLEALGIQQSGLNQLIHAAYGLLGLQTYFTAGVKEVRAWTIPYGTKAPQAAGVIHSDFERGFIRAEVIKFKDFVFYKSELAAKEAGKLAIQGKDYIVEDGDILHFRFNV
ncbi:MAG: redox-regulated ATPase YchF [Bacteroidia bacterium]|nr:redox-regulated ATPase YchF [Bacteroidia bacterium]